MPKNVAMIAATLPVRIIRASRSWSETKADPPALAPPTAPITAALLAGMASVNCLVIGG